LCDGNGHALVRLRGQFWSKASMDLVVATLGLQAETLQGVVSTKELAHEHPRLAYWFERSRLHLGLAVAAGAGVLSLVVWVAFLAFHRA
jgi:hypothetical protein